MLLIVWWENKFCSCLYFLIATLLLHHRHLEHPSIQITLIHCREMRMKRKKVSRRRVSPYKIVKEFFFLKWKIIIIKIKNREEKIPRDEKLFDKKIIKRATTLWIRGRKKFCHASERAVVILHHHFMLKISAHRCLFIYISILYRINSLFFRENPNVLYC